MARFHSSLSSTSLSHDNDDTNQLALGGGTSASTKKSYNAEINIGVILDEMKQPISDVDVVKKSLGVEMKNNIINLLLSSSESDKVWRKAWELIRQYTTELSGLEDPALLIPVEAYNALLISMTSNGHNRTIKSSNWKEATQILDEMVLQSKIHPSPDFLTYKILLEATCCAGKAEQAVQIFMSMRKEHLPSLQLYDIVITACLKKYHWRRAMQLLDFLCDDHSMPNEFTDNSITIAMLYNNVITSFAKAGEISKAMQLFTDMCQRRIASNNSIPITTYHALMSACASSDRYWKDALKLFEECTTNNSHELDVYTYTIAIRACARGRKVSRALALLQEVKDKDLPLDIYLYTAAMDACAKAGLWQRALELLDEILVENKSNSIVPNAFTYTVAIAACSNGGQWERALELLSQMGEHNIKANTVTYNTVLSALARGSTNKMKKVVKQQMTNIYLRNDMEHGSNTPSTSKYGQQQDEDLASSPYPYIQPLQETVADDKDQLWRKALDLLDQMKKVGVKADAITYSSAIIACGSAGRWKESLQLVKIMQEGGPTTRPNRIAYTNAITACGRSGEYEHALELFKDMKKDGLKPDRVSYNALISALKVSNQPEKVFQLWSEMTAASSRSISISSITISPDIVTVTDVLAALERSPKWRDKSDIVFAEAVNRKILLKEDSLDSVWEVDLSGMSFPVAHAAVRYVIQRLVGQYHTINDHSEKELQDITFITGVGTSSYRQKDDEMVKAGLVPKTLREFVRETLRNEFELFSTIPKFSAGTVVIKKEMLMRWITSKNM